MYKLIRFIFKIIVYFMWFSFITVFFPIPALLFLMTCHNFEEWKEEIKDTYFDIPKVIFDEYDDE